MSSENTMIRGELVALGTPEGSEQPRALVHCTEAELKGLKSIFVGQRVVIVPLVNLNGSSVPPIVLECERLRTALAEAREVIKVWHGDGEIWELYQHSPEMKRINAALGIGATGGAE